MLASLEKNQHVKFKPKPIITTFQFKTIFIKSQSLPFKQFFGVAILFAYMAFMRISNIAPKNVELCPVYKYNILQRQFPVRQSDPLLSYYAAGILRIITQNQLRAAFSNIITSLNYDINLTFHSLQRSGASLAFASGVQFSSIQAHGNWTSDALWSYIDHTARDTSVPALFASIFSK
jgi:hypothetical protein